MCDECLAPGVINYDRGCDNMSLVIVVFKWAEKKLQQLRIEQLNSKVDESTETKEMAGGEEDSQLEVINLPYFKIRIIISFLISYYILIF